MTKEQIPLPGSLPTLEGPIQLEPQEAEAAISAVMPHATGTDPIMARFGPHGVRVQLPGKLVHLILRILQETARGNAVALVPVGGELTSQQAAALLNVSRPYVIRLMEEGRLPFHKVGTHRRVRTDDLLRYRRQVDAQRERALDAMAAFDQAHGLQ